MANNAHAEISIQALNCGKHVLCEKPMATTLEDCEKMVKAASEMEVSYDWSESETCKAHVKAKQLIADGAIGTVRTFKTTFGHCGPETWSIDPGKSSWFFDKKRAAMGANG